MRKHNSLTSTVIGYSVLRKSKHALRRAFDVAWPTLCPQKVSHLTVALYRPIFKILSPIDLQKNSLCRPTHHKDFHLIIISCSNGVAYIDCSFILGGVAIIPNLNPFIFFPNFAVLVVIKQIIKSSFETVYWAGSYYILSQRVPYTNNSVSKEICTDPAFTVTFSSFKLCSRVAVLSPATCFYTT